jgi:hypothetical protein
MCLCVFTSLCDDSNLFINTIFVLGLFFLLFVKLTPKVFISKNIFSIFVFVVVLIIFFINNYLVRNLF